MKKSIPFCLLAAMPVLFFSCSPEHYMYAPSAPLSPGLSSKGEMKVGGGFTSELSNRKDSYANGYDLQGAYAVGNHLALTAAYSGRHEKYNYSYAQTGWAGPSYYTTIWYKRSTTDLGIGYFTPLNQLGTSFFDLYAGFGFGKYRMHEDGLRDSLPMNLNHNCSIGKFYLQPGFHFNTSDVLQVSLSMRITTTSYSHIQSDYTKDQEISFGMYDIRNTNYTYVEPCLAFRFTIPDAAWLRFETQYALAVRGRSGPDYRPSTFLAGLSFDFSKIGQHKTEKHGNDHRRTIADPRF